MRIARRVSRYVVFQETIEYTSDCAKNVDVAEVKVVKGSEAFHEAMIQQPPALLSPRSILLFACILVGFLCQTMNGFDGSLFGGLTANSKFLVSSFCAPRFPLENPSLFDQALSRIHTTDGRDILHNAFKLEHLGAE